MRKYIDRAALFNSLSNAKTVEEIYAAIQAAPAEDVEPVRRGRWIRTGEDGYCSVCKCDMPMFRNDWEWEYTETPYCPNCGTRMDGEEE